MYQEAAYGPHLTCGYMLIPQGPGETNRGGIGVKKVKNGNVRSLRSEDSYITFLPLLQSLSFMSLNLLAVNQENDGRSKARSACVL